jgi:hypothetical protein
MRDHVSRRATLDRLVLVCSHNPRRAQQLMLQVIRTCALHYHNNWRIQHRICV